MTSMKWHATVVVAGVPAVTDHQLEVLTSMLPGVVTHDADRQQLCLVWRFSHRYGEDPVGLASGPWWHAVNQSLGIEGVRLVEFHVVPAPSEEEDRAELARFFREQQ